MEDQRNMAMAGTAATQVVDDRLTNWDANGTIAQVRTEESEDKLRSRFSSITWASPLLMNTPILVVGAGGIGSWTALFLARVGYNSITVMDDDIVQKHNIGGQFHPINNVGSSKVASLYNEVQRMANKLLTTQQLKFTDRSVVRHPIVISAVDSMEARVNIFNAWKKYIEKSTDSINDKKVALFIDGRLLAEQLQVYFVTPDRIEDYEKTLFPDSEAEPEMCSNKQTTHFAATIAADIIKGLSNYMATIIDPDCARTIPFSIEEEGFLLTQKVTL